MICQKNLLCARPVRARYAEAWILKIIKTRGSFHSEEVATKLLYLALRNVTAKWEAIRHWEQALNQFELLWGGRIRAATGALPPPECNQYGRPETKARH